MFILFILHFILLAICLVLAYVKDGGDCIDDTFFYNIIPFFGLYMEILCIISFSSMPNRSVPNEDCPLPLITYKEFEDYFYLNPEKWKIEEDSRYYCFSYLKEDKERHYNSQRLYVTLNKKDYKKAFKTYTKYAQNKEHIENESKKNNNRLIFLNSIKKDIEEIQKQSDKEIEEVKKTSQEVAERLAKIN